MESFPNGELLGAWEPRHTQGTLAPSGGVLGSTVSMHSPWAPLAQPPGVCRPLTGTAEPSSLW